MAVGVFLNGQSLQQVIYDKEDQFEGLIVKNVPALFGSKAVYINAKHRVGTTSFGQVIPDGILIDLNDPDSPEFYLVEVELQKHDFFGHILPQITKLFAFYGNSREREGLTEAIFSLFKQDKPLAEKRREQIGSREIYKFLKDTMETSRNILILIDGPKPEFEEIMNTSADTWGKMVQVQIINHFRQGDNHIITCDPPDIDLGESPEERRTHLSQYSEEWHLEKCSEQAKGVYAAVKREFLEARSSLKLNFTKGYIGVAAMKKQIAFLLPRKKKVRMIVLLPENEVAEFLRSHHHTIVSHTETTQRYWGGSSSNCAVEMNDMVHFDEIKTLIRTLVSTYEET